MFRRLFTVLSALSLLLCVAVSVLWVRSYFVVDLHYRGGAHAHATGWVRTNVDLVSADGRLCVVIARHWMTGGHADFERWKAAPRTPREDGGLWRSVRDVDPADALDTDRQFDLRWEDRPDGALRYTERTVIAPHWCFSLCFAVVPSLWARRAMKRRRRARRTAAGRCPECGAFPAPPPKHLPA